MIPARPSPSRTSYSVLILILLLALLFSGCSKSPPSAPLAVGQAIPAGRDFVAGAGAGFGSGTFYPLIVGNLWTYQGGNVLRAVNGDGGAPWDDLQFAFQESRHLIGTTHHEGTAYVVEEQVDRYIPEGEYGPYTAWFRYRQDPMGLFGLDTLLLVPPPLDSGGSTAAAPAIARGHALAIDIGPWVAHGAKSASLERFVGRIETLRKLVRGSADRQGEATSPGGLEIQLLAYPLYPGQSWSNRPDFPWPSSVNRVESLDTPAGRFTAYRIDIVPGGTPLEPGEWVRAWYSRAGYLGYSIHTFSQETDANGDPTGVTYVYDDSMYVSSVQISR